MAYRFLTQIAGTALRPLAWRADWAQRLALPAPDAADIWLHAASVGELQSVQVLAQELMQDHRLLVTANTATGRATAQAWDAAARLAPFDAPQVVARFLDGARPRVALSVENELWPNRSAALAARGVAQIVIGARMSARSARRWARLPGLIGPVLGRITALSAQDAESEARLIALGLPPSALVPRLDLKLLAPAQMARNITPPADPRRDRTVLAASTHDGEDAPILDAYLTARAALPDLRLILAPRHPDRAESIAVLMQARGLPIARRSQGANLTAPVLLADTLGEMSRWYAAAGLCLIAGSWTDRGGHTPWEPAAHRCAIVHGPHVSNFADSYAALAQAGAAQMAWASDLADAILALTADPAPAHAMGRAARATLLERAGDPAPLLTLIRSHA